MKKRIILAVIALLAFCTDGFCWCFGHKVVAHIAKQHLTPATQQKLDYYLDGSIVEYSLWMDRFRYEPSVLALNRSHMGVCNADMSCNPSKDSENGNIEACIVYMTDLLKNHKQLCDSTVRTELKLLIHSVGDMHCPGHFYMFDMPAHKSGGKMVRGMKSKYGWFKFNYEGQEMTYHALWDVALERMYPEFELKLGLFTKKIDSGVTREMAEDMIQGGPLDWGKDRNIRCRQIYDWVKPGDSIDHSFFDEHGWLVDEMMLKAGYRLAHVLNQIFDENYKGL